MALSASHEVIAAQNLILSDSGGRDGLGAPMRSWMCKKPMEPTVACL